MAARKLASLVPHGRSSISTSAFCHVFGLVDSYMSSIKVGSEGGYVATLAQKPLSASCGPSHPTVHFRRYAAVAHAHVEPEDPPDSKVDQYYHRPRQRLPDGPDIRGEPSSLQSPPPAIPAELPAETASSPHLSDLSSAPLSTSLSTPSAVLSFDTVYHGPRRTPRERSPKLYQLPIPVYNALLSGEYKSSEAFLQAWQNHGCSYKSLVSRHNLGLVFDLWLKTANDPSWRWLLGMMPDVLGEARSLPGSIPFIHGVHGYILARTESEGARDELETADNGLGVLATSFQIDPSEWAVVALGWSSLGEYQTARERIVLMVRERLGRTPRYCPPHEAVLLQAYHKNLPPSRLFDDLMWIFKLARKQLREVMLYPGKQETSTLSLTDVWYKAFAMVPNPLEWAKQQFAADPSSASKHLVMLLFVALVGNNRVDESVQVWRFLKENSCTIPTTASTQLAAKLVKSGSSLGFEVFAGDKASHMALSHMLEALVEAGHMSNARVVLRQIKARFKPIRSDRDLIPLKYATHGDFEQTRIALEEAYDTPLSAGAIEILVRAYCNANDPIGAENLYKGRRMTTGGLNTILRLYADRAELGPAVRLFERFLEQGLQPNIKTYTPLITLFAQRLDVNHVDQLLSSMRAKGIEPDAIIWAALLNVSVNRGDYLEAASRWESLSSEMKAAPQVSAAIFRAFVYLAVPIDLIISYFRKFERPDTRQWALVIQSACDNGNTELARQLFDEMEAKGDPKPDVVTLSILLHAHLKVNDGTSARAVYEEMTRRDLLKTSITYSQIVHSFTIVQSQQSLDQAHDFAVAISRMARNGQLPEVGAERSRVTERLFQPLVVASGRMGLPDYAKAYFDIASTDEAPTMGLRTALLDSYRRAGDVDKVMATWRGILDHVSLATVSSTNSPRPQANALSIPLSIVLDALSTRGRPADVRDVWKSVRDAGFGFDSGNYNHYAIALARTGDVESAFHVIDRVVIPRYIEIRERRAAALRNSAQLPLIDTRQNLDESAASDQIIEIEDTPVDSAFPAGRPERFRPENPFPSRIREEPDKVTKQLLESWRPSDILWRPSLLTIAVLDRAYDQVRKAARRARGSVLLPAGDEGDGDDQEDLRLESFGGVPLRDPDGQPTKSSAEAFIARLNRKYARTVGMIMFHRRKRKVREKAGGR